MSKKFISYNEVHRLIGRSIDELVERFQPSLLIAISAGGFLPTRILRNFLKTKFSGKSLPIQTIGLSLYENESGRIKKTQWIDSNYPESPLAICFSGENLLIVDEVDETRTTLAFAIENLSKDIEKQREDFRARNQAWIEPKIAVFVVHNKNIEKRAQLPQQIMDQLYFAAETVGPEWIVYPWDAFDIDQHTALAENC